MGNQRLKMAEGSPLWPAWDMVETKEDVRLTIDIPGMTTDAFELVFDGQTLRIFGERQRYARPEPHTLVMADRFAGSFDLEIPMPCPVETHTLEAEYYTGELCVSIKKTAAVRKVITMTFGGEASAGQHGESVAY